MGSTFQVGVWETKNATASVVAGKKNSKTINFASAEPDTPYVPVGLRMVAIDNNKNAKNRIGGKTYMSDLHEDKFTLNIDSLPHTKLMNGAAMWMKYPNDDSDFKYDIVDLDNSQHATVPATKRIVFDTPFDTQPKVFVGISGFDISTDWRLHVYATDIDVNGFTLHADPLATTELNKVQINWIAFPASRPDVLNGTFSTVGDGSFNGQVNFQPTFTSVPQIFYALTMIDSETSKDLHIRVEVSSVTASGFNWKITGPGVAKNRVVSASFLAMIIE